MRRATGLIAILTMLLLPAAPGAQAAETKTVDVTVTEYKFSLSAITIRVNRVLILHPTNKGTVTHEFRTASIFKASKDVKITGAFLKAREAVEIRPGRTVPVSRVPVRLGVYRFWCGEVSKGRLHRDLGERGIVTVVL